jgi:iron complex outermembrane receptor protein
LFDNRLILLAGLRYDGINQTVTNVQTRFTPASEVEQQDDAITPRLGILYRLLPELSIYGSYSRSFNPNSGTTVQGNILEPETGAGFEAGIKAELLNGKLLATVAYFDAKKQNIAVADPQFLGFFIPTGEQRSRGIELDLAGEILPGWNIISSYAYTDAEITNDSNPSRIGSRLANIPNHSGGLWTTYEIQTGSLKGLGFGAGFNYVGERFGGLPNSYRANAYWLANAAVFYKTGKWRLAINIRNFTNTHYVQALSTTSRIRANYVGEPLTVLGSVSFEF